MAKSEWTIAAMDGVEARKRAIEAVLNSLPHEVTPGARHVAMVTSFRGAQAWALREVVAALEELERLPPEAWDMGFMVAGAEKFDVATAKRERFASFQDFYHREIAPTWGRWHQLIETYQDRVANKIDDKQAAARIKQSAREMAADPKVKALADAPGRPEGSKNNVANRHINTRSSDSVERIVRRLKRDHPKINEALARGEFKSARAAGIAAGFIVPPTPLDRLDKAWEKASEEDRNQFCKKHGLIKC